MHEEAKKTVKYQIAMGEIEKKLITNNRVIERWQAEEAELAGLYQR